jgi:hypothetical protein
MIKQAKLLSWSTVIQNLQYPITEESIIQTCADQGVHFKEFYSECKAFYDLYINLYDYIHDARPSKRFTDLFMKCVKVLNSVGDSMEKTPESFDNGLSLFDALRESDQIDILPGNQIDVKAGVDVVSKHASSINIDEVVPSILLNIEEYLNTVKGTTEEKYNAVQHWAPKLIRMLASEFTEYEIEQIFDKVNEYLYNYHDIAAPLLYTHNVNVKVSQDLTDPNQQMQPGQVFINPQTQQTTKLNEVKNESGKDIYVVTDPNSQEPQYIEKQQFLMNNQPIQGLTS